MTRVERARRSLFYHARRLLGCDPMYWKKGIELIPTGRYPDSPCDLGIQPSRLHALIDAIERLEVAECRARRRQRKATAP